MLDESLSETVVLSETTPLGSVGAASVVVVGPAAVAALSGPLVNCCSLVDVGIGIAALVVVVAVVVVVVEVVVGVVVGDAIAGDGVELCVRGGGVGFGVELGVGNGVGFGVGNGVGFGVGLSVHRT